MYLARVSIRNFRSIGDSEPPFCVAFGAGLTALVGENDSGKTAVVDAIRFALLTRDADYVRLDDDDFHIEPDGDVASEISICCAFTSLTVEEIGAFAEYLTYEEQGPALYVHWQARRVPGNDLGRRHMDVTVRAGPEGEGPALDSLTRQLLAPAYLRPLRDAEREMAPGRGSRLAQVLGHLPDIAAGEDFDVQKIKENSVDPESLNLVGMSDYIRHLVDQHPAVVAAERSINASYLTEMRLNKETLHGRIAFAEGGSAQLRLRRILERLELGLLDSDAQAFRGRFGLGSNNLVFMACELLLLGKDEDAVPLLLIEEPEAHLHPQRQLRLMEFLMAAASDQVDGARPVQIIVTTHSPNLASKVPVSNLVLLDRLQAFCLSPGQTALALSDYRFLERFLDATKANLFFARGLLIVEGDAEAIIIPFLAEMLNCSLTSHGTSIVNVGGTGLRRYARVLQRNDPESGEPQIAVSCVADMDVMPNCAPQMLGLIEDDNDPAWGNPRRRWRAVRDFGETEELCLHGMVERRKALQEHDTTYVRTFIADHWTLEYDLARSGLAEYVWAAAALAGSDDAIHSGRRSRSVVVALARIAFTDMRDRYGPNSDELATAVYAAFHRDRVSKPVAAQYLVELMTGSELREPPSPTYIRDSIPQYLIHAIRFATGVDGPEKPNPATTS